MNIPIEYEYYSKQVSIKLLFFPQFQVILPLNYCQPTFKIFPVSKILAPRISPSITIIYSGPMTLVTNIISQSFLFHDPFPEEKNYSKFPTPGFFTFRIYPGFNQLIKIQDASKDIFTSSKYFHSTPKILSLWILQIINQHSLMLGMLPRNFLPRFILKRFFPLYSCPRSIPEKLFSQDCSSQY